MKQKNNFLPTIGNMVFTIVVVSIALLTQHTWASRSAVNATIIPYQGYLTDANGNPLNGSHTITLALYDSPTGGSLIWGPEQHPDVVVTNGTFDLDLGSRTSGGISPEHGYLEIEINGQSLTPREQLFSNKTSQIVAMEDCRNGSCANVTENYIRGWHPVKGTAIDDDLEILVTVQPEENITVNMTARALTSVEMWRWCGVRVMKAEDRTQVEFIHLQGSGAMTTDFGCSGTYTLRNLPAGNYFIRGEMFFENHNASSSETWLWAYERQITARKE